MNPLGYYLGMPKQVEVLILTLLGIGFTVCDPSLLDLNTNLHKVWELGVDSLKIFVSTQIYLKYLLTGIIVIRTFTVHLYLAFYIVMLWPAVFEERPALLLPWLMTGAIKCLSMGMVTFFTGIITCISYGIFRPACPDFILAHLLDNAFSFYAWFSVFSYYKELKISHMDAASFQINSIEADSEITIRRRRVRSMSDNSAKSPYTHHQILDEDRQFLSVSTIETFVQQITTDLHRKTTRSLDTLLAVMVAEAEKEEIMNQADEQMSDDPGLSIQEKTIKLLKLTEEDIKEARKKRKMPLLTESMMSINGVFGKINLAEKAAFRSVDLALINPAKIKADLRCIKNNIRQKIDKVTPFVREESETQIGSVYNYSTSSSEVSMVEDDMRFLIENDLLDQIMLQVAKNEQFKNDAVVAEEPHVINAQGALPKEQKSDFECQASTLSRSVLEYFELNSHFGKIIPALKKVSPRNPLTKQSLYDNCKGNNSKLSESYRRYVQEMQKPTSINNTCSFRLDGYTMAYIEKMEKAKERNSEQQ